MKYLTFCCVLLVLANFTIDVDCRSLMRRKPCLGGYNGHRCAGRYQEMIEYPGSRGYNWRGGYTGMGGIGNNSPYGTYKKKIFYGGKSITTVLVGIFGYHMASHLLTELFGDESSRMLVSVYNYYNHHELKEEMELSSNVFALCEGNSTKLCTPGTTAICTTNSTILCVATMAQAQPCAEEEALCINTTMPCLDTEDPVCQNVTHTQKETPISLPCFTNLTVDVNLLNETRINQNEDYKYCVTTMAVASPKYQICNDTDKVSDYRSVLEGNYKWNLTIRPMRQSYTIYNFKHSIQMPSLMQVDFLIPCVEKTMRLCVPGVTPICTIFGDIMCLELLSSAPFCEQYGTTCIKRNVLCLENDPLCKDKTEGELIKDGDKTLVSFELPCFANITVISKFPNFDISSFNGTFPESSDMSYTYHVNYCLTTLGVPGPQTALCLTTLPDVENQHLD